MQCVAPWNKSADHSNFNQWGAALRMINTMLCSDRLKETALEDQQLHDAAKAVRKS